MTAIREANNLGDVLKYEAPNLYSRDRVTVASGQTLALGSVVGVVTATGKVKALDPAATDGTEVAFGVIANEVDAALADREDGILIARHAVVASLGLVWPEGITPTQKADATAQLRSLGILVRTSA
jgi:hypothetical protein